MSDLPQAPEVLTLELNRTVRAPRARVFAAFTSIDELKRWFCPEGCFVRDGSMDFRVGGDYRMEISTAQAGDVDLVGTFQEIVPDEKLVYTWEWKNNEKMNIGDTLVTVLFSEEDGATEVKVIHEGLPGQEACEGHRHGWDGSFDKLDRRYDGGD